MYSLLVSLSFVYVLGIHALQTCDGLLIGAFNVQIFGQKKSRNPDVMNILIKIIRRYDIILIQEIKDTTNVTLNNLMNALNTPGATHFTHETSNRLGSTVSKEQYSFLIRIKSGVTVVDKYQFPEELKKFERPPFSVKLSSVKSVIKDFVLLAIHTKPEAAVKEIDELKQVHAEVRRRWKTDNILIMGDLNAGCAYASRRALNKLEIRNESQFIWLIPDTVDTTTKQSNCAYDRFIMTGATFSKSLVPNSAQVFPFDQMFQLSSNQTIAVSDHYPIELQLRNTIELQLSNAVSMAPLTSLIILSLLNIIYLQEIFLKG